MVFGVEQHCAACGRRMFSCVVSAFCQGCMRIQENVEAELAKLLNEKPAVDDRAEERKAEGR